MTREESRLASSKPHCSTRWSSPSELQRFEESYGAFGCGPFQRRATWEFAIDKYSDECYDPEERFFSGAAEVDGAIEGAMRAGQDPHRVDQRGRTCRAVGQEAGSLHPARRETCRTRGRDQPKREVGGAGGRGTAGGARPRARGIRSRAGLLTETITAEPRACTRSAGGSRRRRPRGPSSLGTTASRF